FLAAISAVAGFVRFAVLFDDAYRGHAGGLCFFSPFFRQVSVNDIVAFTAIHHFYVRVGEDHIIAPAGHDSPSAGRGHDDYFSTFTSIDDGAIRTFGGGGVWDIRTGTW